MNTTHSILINAQNRLNREKQEKEAVNEDLKAKCVELQMLKFGKLVDIEGMQESRTNEGLEELKVGFHCWSVD